MDVDELIEWLKKEGFDYPSTFEKLKEEQFNGHIFGSAFDDDLAKLDPSLKKGPQIQLRTLRDKLKKIITETGTSPKPPVPSPAPRPESTPAVPTPTGEDQSGENSQEYKAVKNNFSDITKTIRMTSSALEDMRQKFVEKDWLDPGRKPNEEELVNLVLGRIMRRVSEFRVFVTILRGITGLDLIADKLEGAVQGWSSLPASTTAVGSVTKQQPMTHPVYDKAPTIPCLKLLQWSEIGRPKKFRLIDRVAKNWRELGSAGLGMEEHVLNNLEDKLSNVSSCSNVLQRFLENGSPDYERPTWGNLILALRKAEMNEVASTLQEVLPLWHKENK